ncbi:maleylacetate reductase [Pseudolabrys taiwanensis]|uniref:Maleylacetate reductase n=1 Tax=Pseudolabrys taiwanensis TaxID=331696 RepID=A0A345ZVL0_9HYPH|nr:maleylacetate reductase [Pseudolabrys taiwanensis]AXK80957.1 maleylacetate reductase [Pseudolabrys taiwanensis]
METFVYNGLPTRVIFGSGTAARLRAEIERTPCRRAFVVGTREQAASVDAVAASLGPIAVDTFAGAAMHTPTDVTQSALERFKECGADCTVAVGGGSAVGLGKAIALRTDAMQFVLPTTYAGSEMTPILGETENGVKTTQRSPKVQPEVAIYDVDLTLTLPAKLSTTSGMNAIAHAVEALYAEDRNPIISVMAEQAITALGRALPVIVANPQDRPARSDALYGAWLCGMCLGSVGMALHHKLCHVLGGSFDLPHAETHTVVLPHAFAYNAAAAPAAEQVLRRALGGNDGARALFDLAGALKAPTSLRSLGMPEDGIDHAADLAVKNPYWNPRPLERQAIRDLIAGAWAGEPPVSGAEA